METMKWGNVSGQILKENIILLQMLGETHGENQEKPIPQYVRDRPCAFDRKLTIEQERDLVDILAFISGSSADPKKISAVCVEEHPSGDAITIRIAANRGDTAATQEAFQRIAAVLERIAHRGEWRRREYDAIFGEIISCDRQKLLSRLKSRHVPLFNKRKVGIPGAKRLLEAVAAIQESDLYSPREELVELHRKATEMHTVTQQLESQLNPQLSPESSDGILKTIVSCADSISSQHNLENILSYRPKLSGFGPVERTNVSKNIEKIGKYKKSCDILVAFAKQWPIFRKIFVESVKIPVSHPTSRSTVLRQSVAEIIARNTSKRGLVRNPAATCDTAQADYTQLIGEASKNAKIHAEIQLLYFYQQRQGVPAIRVIGSSKSACLLCDLFVSSHKTFYMRRTHGVLYTKWTLPSSQALNLAKVRRQAIEATVEAFDQSIKQKIKLALTKTSVKAVPPNESECDKLSYESLSSESHISRSTIRAVQTATLLQERPQSSKIRLESFESSQSIDQVPPSSHIKQINQAETGEGASSIPSKLHSSPTSSTSTLRSSKSPPMPLARAEPVADSAAVEVQLPFDPKTIHMNNRSLRLILSEDVEVSADAAPRRQRSVKIELLHSSSTTETSSSQSLISDEKERKVGEEDKSQGAHTTHKAAKTKIINVKDMQEGVDMTLAVDCNSGGDPAERTLILRYANQAYAVEFGCI